ncbi:hypothetical protein HYU09_03590 [Candidatus Woesearchaeota archaeon]|nr:hypothetical protein [Candidatus Woesearchaeota archaeon]
MRIKNSLLVLLAMLVLAIFLIGCQQQVSETKEISDAMEIVDEAQEPAADEYEQEFDDGLDAALQELEEIEDV